MEKITKLTAEEFLKRAMALDVGERFSFATDIECDGEPKSEDDLAEWYGIQKICLFDNDMCVVSKYGGPGCRVFCTDKDYAEIAIDEMFRYMSWYGVYVVEEAPETQQRSATITAARCLDIRGYTNCGENILIPASEVREIVSKIEESYVAEDVVEKVKEMWSVVGFTKKEVRQIANAVISRRDKCEVIYEAYWQIVEEAIKEFIKDKRAAGENH